MKRLNDRKLVKLIYKEMDKLGHDQDVDMAIEMVALVNNVSTDELHRLYDNAGRAAMAATGYALSDGISRALAG